MANKYICTKNPKDNDKEEIFVFPKSVNHDCMFEVIGRLRTRLSGNWLRPRRELVSAGFISHEGICYGESESLRCESRLEDTAIYKAQR